MSRTPRMPKGWFAAGSHPAEYEMGLDPGSGPARGGTAYIKAGERPQGFATLMQSFKADAYRGKRLRFSAAVRANGIEQWAGLWMRVDGSPEQMLAFDNMQNRPITGTRDWETHAVVLDVPERSSRVALGILLLVPTTSRLAAWGLVALLIAVFPANLFMYQHPEKFGLSPTLLLLRLPLQGILILWAYVYTRR